MSDHADTAPSAPSNAATSSDAAPSPHCSECGWGTPSHKPHTPLWPKLILWLLPLIATAALVVDAMRATSRFTTGPIYNGMKLVDPIITRADLRAIASGDTAIRDGEPLDLLGTLIKKHPPSRLGFGEVRYQVALAKPNSGSASRTIAFGFPIKWFDIQTQRHVRDLVNLAEPMTVISRRPRAPGPYTPPPRGTREIDPGPKFGPNLVAWTLKPELTRATVVTITSKYTFALAALALATIAALVASSACRRLMKRHPKRSRRVGLIASACAVLIILFFPDDRGAYKWAFYIQTTTRGLLSPVFGKDTSLDRGASLSTLTLESLRAMPVAEANAALAADILRLCNDASDASPDEPLFAAACIENWNVNTLMVDGPGRIFFYSYIATDHERCPDFGKQEPVTMPPTREMKLGWPTIAWLRSSGTPGDPSTRITIDLPGLIAALTLILAPGLIPFLLHRRHIRRRAAKRERNNLCPSCAYPFPALASKDTCASHP